MPVERDSDGNIKVRPTQGSHDLDGRPTVPMPGQNAQGSVRSGADSDYSAPTVLAGRSGRQNQAPEKRTRIYRADSDGSASPEPVGRTAAMQDPPVGWLVVVDGLGQGNVVTLGNGFNSIGRDGTERLSLPFGDELISRSNHAAITYDPRSKKFYIQHGGGTNLTYVNNQPVLVPQELPPHTEIQIGATILRFMPLCGDQFGWNDQDAG